MPILSLITPVLVEQHAHLRDTYTSLAAQTMPPGWDWEWIIQEDGTTHIPARELPTHDPRVKPDTGRRGRAPMARMMALSRANGILMRQLDADDLLLPGALWRDITTLTTHPDTAWVVSSHLDYLPDGTTRPTPLPGLPAGPLPAGHIRAVDTAKQVIPVHGTTITVHTQLAHALGGWLAIPSVEDAEFLLACTTVAGGWMIPEPSLLYRLWPAQSTQKPGYTHPGETWMRSRAIDKRINALTRAGWRYTPGRLDEHTQQQFLARAGHGHTTWSSTPPASIRSRFSGPPDSP